MREHILILLGGLIVALMVAGTARADEVTETRLRDALRQAITQQRSMEDELARLKAKSSQDDQVIADLKAQPPKAAAPDTAILEKMEAEFNRRLAEQHETLARAGETLEKWQAAYEEAAGTARAKEAERAQLAAQAEGLTQRATSCEAKNARLFEAANEILGHLKDISVAEAMAAHEPFVGTKRVELQNLAQDAEDKLLDQKVTVPAVAAPPAMTAAGGRP